jgi:hypothetical protein
MPTHPFRFIALPVLITVFALVLVQPFASAQMSTDAVGYAYVDIVIDSGGDTISAISVNQTWGLVDHTSSTSISLQSSDGRTVSHRDGYAETAMAIASVPVCTPETCHSGTYKVKSQSSGEFYPRADQHVDSVGPAEEEEQGKYLWIFGVAFTKSSIKSRNDQVNLDVRVFRTNGCAATSAEVLVVTEYSADDPAQPIVITADPSPNIDVPTSPQGIRLPFSFSGSATTSETITQTVTFRTPPDSPSPAALGRAKISAIALSNNGGCIWISPLARRVDLQIVD